MHRGDGADDLRAVDQRGGQAADVALHLVGVGVVGDLLRVGDAQRPVGHVAQDIFGLGEDLGRLGAVDRVEVRVVFEPVFARGREDDRHAFHRGGIGDRAPLPLGDPVGAEVEFQFATVVGRHGVAAGAYPGSGRVIRGLGVDQLVEPGDVFLGGDAPDARWRGCRDQLDVFGELPEEEVVVDEVPLVRIEVGLEATLVGHVPLQLADDPVGEAQALDYGRLLFFLGRHLLERDLCPDRFPHRGVGLVDRAEFEQVQVALLGLVVVAIVAVIVQEDLGEALEGAASRFSGGVGVRRHRCRAEPGDQGRRHERRCQLGHARISLRTPLPASNLAAICSLMLKRSCLTPTVSRIVE